MSFVVSGITHCSDCGKPLDIGEFCRCSQCQKRYDQDRERIKFNLAVAKRVKIELAKMNKDIKTIVLKNMDGKERKYSGYWEENVFNILE